MAGSKSGTAAQIRSEEPRAVLIHCYEHSLSFACGDAIKHCKILNNAMETTHEITKLVKLSPRREAIFQEIQQAVAPGSPGLRLLCPTRWTVLVNAFKSMLDNYVADLG